MKVLLLQICSGRFSGKKKCGYRSNKTHQGVDCHRGECRGEGQHLGQVGGKHGADSVPDVAIRCNKFAVGGSFSHGLVLRSQEASGGVI